MGADVEIARRGSSGIGSVDGHASGFGRLVAVCRERGGAGVVGDLDVVSDDLELAVRQRGSYTDFSSVKRQYRAGVFRKSRLASGEHVRVVVFQQGHGRRGSRIRKPEYSAFRIGNAVGVMVSGIISGAYLMVDKIHHRSRSESEPLAGRLDFFGQSVDLSDYVVPCRRAQGRA